MQDVQKVVEQCRECQSIDPAPARHEKGELHVEENWRRLAIDITHYQHEPHVTMIDCGPGRVAIWRKIKNETAEEVKRVVEEVFMERGPVEEVLVDNGTSFRSEVFRDLCAKWNVGLYFRAAYRPSGNGIIERHHRTIKAVASRSQISPQEAVFWYNMMPKAGQDENSVPHRFIFSYEW